jgi:hypothetical protein
MANELEIGRLKVNPFDFQPNADVASRYLQETSAELHEFFLAVLDGTDDFYRLWNSFDGHQDELFRLILAARTWARVTRLGNTGLTILFGIFFLEAIAGYSTPEFPGWLRQRRGSDETPVLESDIGTFYREFQQDTGAMRSVRELLQRHLSDEEKVELLAGFEFTRPYRLGDDAKPWNHLYCKRDMCGSWCDPPAAGEVEELFGRLVNRLYEMRSAVVHRNAFVLFASETDTSEGIATVPLLYDAYFLRKGKMQGYSTEIEVARLSQLFKAATVRHVLGLSPGKS